MDIQVIRITARLKNHRTSVEWIEALELIEIRDRSLVVELPDGSCAEGHEISVRILIEGHEELGDLEISAVAAKPLDHDDLECQRVYAVLDFTDYHEGSWNRLLESLEGQQEAIHRLLRSLRD
jgi:hypothetical protein